MRPLWDAAQERVTPFGATWLSSGAILLVSAAAGLLSWAYLAQDPQARSNSFFLAGALAMLVGLAAGIMWGFGMSGWRREERPAPGSQPGKPGRKTE